MPWISGLVAGGVGLLGSALSGSAGAYGGSYVPPNVDQAANNVLSLTPQLANNNLYQQYLPQSQNLVSTGLNSQYYQPMMNAAQQAGQSYGTAGTNATQYGQQLGSQISNTLAAGNQLYQTAFDPNQALYNQQFAQNQNQTNANLASRGLNMSGAGAQIANQSNQNFNTAWQQQQLANQLAGVQGLSAANTSATGLAQGANLAGASGVQNLTTGATLPYSTQMSGLQSQLGLIGTAGGYGQQATVQPQQQIGNYLQYMGLGNSGQSLAAQQASAATAGAGQIGSSIGQGITSALNYNPYAGTSVYSSALPSSSYNSIGGGYSLGIS